MLYTAQHFHLDRSDDILSLTFDSQASKVNIFSAAALAELREAVDIAAKEGAAGLIFRSGKPGFIVGADITEFLHTFKAPDEDFRSMLDTVNGLFSAIEDLPYPTVAAINGEAQGGGFEVCLACDFRVASTAARVGLPEVKLGIMPGWGGSVRLSRLIGVDNAVEWMCTGAGKKAAAALADGAVDGVVAPDQLDAAAAQLIAQCTAGKFDVAKRRAVKTSAITLSALEKTMAFQSAKGVVGAKAGPNYPAPITIIDTIAAHADMSRDDALAEESKSFIKLARTEVAASLIGIFLKDQALKRLARGWQKQAHDVKQTAVLGAGIMGGGVAYQSASNGVPIIMKDIRAEAIDAGLAEASKLLKKQIERGKLRPEGMADVLNNIQPALTYGEFGEVDLIVEAVVENPKIKQSVLAEVEKSVSPDTIVTTNTSTISVNLLAEALERPENFCGMHFFNPVHRMPLVEVIRANTSSDKAIATTVAYAVAMKKTPIVVNDCPGFLVNRILFAYFSGFMKLIADGANVQAVDKALERFGWPMGPAYLLDVVGMDTARHAGAVMAEGFPDRMASGNTVVDVMFEADRLGQKNGKGFYRYEMDKRGRPKKLSDAEADALVAKVQSTTKEFTSEEMVARLMIPMCIEAARCLDDNIVSSAAEADMGLVYGLGFPPFRGGALQYCDQQGLDAFVNSADSFKALGPLYEPTDNMRRMAAEGTGFYTDANAGENA